MRSPPTPAPNFSQFQEEKNRIPQFGLNINLLQITQLYNVGLGLIQEYLVNVTYKLYISFFCWESTIWTL